MSLQVNAHDWLLYEDFDWFTLSLRMFHRHNDTEGISKSSNEKLLFYRRHTLLRAYFRAYFRINHTLATSIPFLTHLGNI